MTARTLLRCLLPAALAILLSGCEGPPTVPWRAHDGGDLEAASPQTVVLWVSYQIEIEKIDGSDAGLRAPGRCVYYRVVATPGEHELTLRLNYRGPISDVKSAAPAKIRVRLQSGHEYRLLDLAAGTRGQRKFTPWLQPGAPPKGKVESRPAK